LTRTCHLRRLGDDEGGGDLVFFGLPGSIFDGATANGADARTTD
jgi:hypothetical protein